RGQAALAHQLHFAGNGQAHLRIALFAGTALHLPGKLTGIVSAFLAKPGHFSDGSYPFLAAVGPTKFKSVDLKSIHRLKFPSKTCDNNRIFHATSKTCEIFRSFSTAQRAYNNSL